MTTRMIIALSALAGYVLLIAPGVPAQGLDLKAPVPQRDREPDARSRTIKTDL